jgi:hypothetical protein
MDWIKKNYDQALLGLLAIALIGVSVLLFLNTQSFGEKFSDAMAAPSMNRKLPVLDTAVIESAKKKLEKPQTWSSSNHEGLLFTSTKYTVENNMLKPWKGGAQWTDSQTGKPIPNEWFEKYGLPETDEAVVGQDPDGDGFLNEDEWRNDTDPTKKESHPAYTTKLFLAKWVKVPFRLKFQAYDGSPNAPEKMEFQINPLDAGARTEFVKIGDIIERTKFKVIKFQFKEAPNDKTGENEEVSELTLVNTETNDPVTLILNRIVDSPNQFAEFDYRWGKKLGEKGETIQVPKLKQFGLKPETVLYKLVDVNDAEAVIEVTKGDKTERISVKPYPKKQ